MAFAFAELGREDTNSWSVFSLVSVQSLEMLACSLIILVYRMTFMGGSRACMYVRTITTPKYRDLCCAHPLTAAASSSRKWK